MSIDYSAFIARHHKTANLSIPDNLPSRRGSVELLAAFTVFVFAAVLCIVINFSYQNIWVQTISILALVLSVFGVFFAWRSHRKKAVDSDNLHLFYSVLEGSRAARMITDALDRTIYTNQNFERLCRGVGPPGYQTLLRLFDGNDEALAHIRMLGDKAARGLTDSIELFSKYEDQERWLLVTAQPVLSYKDYIHWRVDDVTEKYTVDQAIREEREKLIDFTDNAPVGFFSVNETGRFVFANATFARWLGEDLRVLLDRGTLHVYLSEPPKNAAAYALIENGGARQIVEAPLKGRGGKIFLASINQAVVKEEDGSVTTRAVVYDLTAERKMRAALKESQARFQRFFEEAPLGIVLLDDSGGIEQCNATFAEMTGMPVNEIETQSLNDLILQDQEEARDVTAYVMQHVDTNAIAPLDITLKNKSYKTPDNVMTQMHASRLKESDSIVLYFIDMTEQKQLEVQFVQSQKMQAIGQLAGGVAHDFNNLLTAIIGFCDLLLLRHKPGDPSFADIMQIKQNSNRAANLVRQLLAFSRQQTLRPKVWDITDILTEVSHLLRRLIGASIELDLIHGQDLGLVKVDEGQMEQVLINLVVNARDAMDGKGTLLIETENFTTRKPLELVSEEMPQGHWIKISVKDTGHGIPKQNLNRIFEPFFTTKDVGQGTGLGLATVYGIIRQTGGYLDVKSEIGKGTSFILYLPRVNEIQEEPVERSIDEEDAPVKDLTGTERILLVEDEDAVRTFSQRALSNKGYDVLAAESGDIALTLLEKDENQHLDLLITDVVMPGLDGPALAQRIRQSSPDLKIIFISGYTEDKLKDYMGKNIWFLPKPFTLKQLAGKVKEVLEE